MKLKKELLSLFNDMVPEKRAEIERYLNNQIGKHGHSYQQKDIKKCRDCKYFHDNSHWCVANSCGVYGIFGEKTNAYANKEDYEKGIMIPPKDEETSAETCPHFELRGA